MIQRVKSDGMCDDTWCRHNRGEEYEACDWQRRRDTARCDMAYEERARVEVCHKRRTFVGETASGISGAYDLKQVGGTPLSSACRRETRVFGHGGERETTPELRPLKEKRDWQMS